jgi:hypothetical protein
MKVWELSSKFLSQRAATKVITEEEVREWPAARREFKEELL